ncbi:unnamed protein product [Notodromas monacha]|uniref:Uncharacterized protein n=1 Tax=Notodromas monacha TaxID=399045 RepID=A0A7R9GF52_9CRUS|nr:unnamed protein product [Notodromas monacha]CAG0918982.1 unnamed protein product [Notodromas monacha]
MGHGAKSTSGNTSAAEGSTTAPTVAFSAYHNMLRCGTSPKSHRGVTQKSCPNPLAPARERSSEAWRKEIVTSSGFGLATLPAKVLFRPSLPRSRRKQWKGIPRLLACLLVFPTVPPFPCCMELSAFASRAFYDYRGRWREEKGTAAMMSTLTCTSEN